MMRKNGTPNQLAAYVGTSEFAREIFAKIESEGFAVIPSILSAAEVDVEYSRMWSWVEKVSPGVKRNRPATWQRRSRRLDPWPSKQRDMMQLHQAGWVFNDLREVMAERVFEKLYGTEELHCSKDGFTLQRPTEEELDLTPNDHFDQGSDLQGLQCIQGSVALTDQEHDDGCFLCWPGSHKYHQEIVNRRKKRGRENFIILNDQEKELLYGKGIQPLRVPVRKGDVILFRSDLAHKGAMPIGRRENFRAVVYICMLPAALTPEEVYNDKLQAYQKLETGSHWPNHEEWFEAKQDRQCEVKPFYQKPPPLTRRQRLLYGLDRYPAKPALEASTESKDTTQSKDQSAGYASAPVRAKAGVRRWGRAKAGTSTADASKASDGSDDDGFWNTSGNEATKPQHDAENPATEESSIMKSDHDREVRKLKKALREIDNLEMQQHILGDGVGKLRQNQLQKISKKQEYLARLEELTSSTEDSEA